MNMPQPTTNAGEPSQESRSRTIARVENQAFFEVAGFTEPSPSETPSRRDPAQPALLQVGTPSLGSSHCVSTMYPARIAISHTHSGMLRSLWATHTQFTQKRHHWTPVREPRL
jgi:hypothetical protein